MTDATMNDFTVQGASSARPGDEMLPFLNNFHDIFTTIGVFILFAGLGLGAGQLYSALDLASNSLAAEAVLLGLVGGIGLIAWGLSAILVGKQRRILPGIFLSLAAVGCLGFVLAWLYSRLVVGVVGEAGFEQAFAGFEGMGELSRAEISAALADMPLSIRTWPVALALAFTVPVAAYYVSFRLPFAGGLLGVALTSLAVVIALIIDPYTVIVFNPVVSLATGLALFLAGIIFDARDPARQTRLSGTGFWLHFFAAPTLLGAAITIVNTGWSVSLEDFNEAGMMAGLVAGDDAAALRSAVVTLIVIGAFALVSLLINRRALIVSGLITAGIAMGVVVNQLGLDAAGVAAITLLMLGGVVVLLGVAWTPVRRILTAPFPITGPLARIIPPPVAGVEG
ncbi:hypothetical protein [Oceanicaulis sp.]|uniref:hypothetical protein n=1 Tax=Oceanicaulis sp. TaxID=1924941 RepID=UPI003D29A77A